MSVYYGWFENNIEERLESINEPKDRLKFLYEEKLRFQKANRNPEADQIVKQFDSKIEMIKTLMEYEFKSPQKKTESDDSIDYSDNKIAERIVFLKELGVLDFFERKMKDEMNFFASNKLAEILSSFMGVSQKTIQSYINPIFSPNVDQKNNPCTERNIKKVKKKINDIGLNSD